MDFTTATDVIDLPVSVATETGFFSDPTVRTVGLALLGVTAVSLAGWGIYKYFKKDPTTESGKPAAASSATTSASAGPAPATAPNSELDHLDTVYVHADTETRAKINAFINNLTTDPATAQDFDNAAHA